MIKTQKLLDSLKGFYDKYGRPPKARDCILSNELYSDRTYITRFSSWNNAIIQAGLDVVTYQTFPIDHKIRDITWLKEVSKELTDGQIGGILGCSAGTVSRHKRAANIIGKVKPYSLKEKEVCSFVKESTKLRVLENTRDIIPPKELDIYLPEIKLAIEYNGQYWHSFEKDINKLYLCDALGIELVTVYNNEPYKEIILNALNNKNYRNEEQYIHEFWNT